MSNYFTNPTVSARVQAVPPVYLFLVDDRHKEIGRENQYSPAERRRRYPDDGKRMPVELENAAHHAAVILKIAVPISVGEHNIDRERCSRHARPIHGRPGQGTVECLVRRSSSRSLQRPRPAMVSCRCPAPPARCYKRPDHQSCGCDCADRDNWDTTDLSPYRWRARLCTGSAPEAHSARAESTHSLC